MRDLGPRRSVLDMSDHTWWKKATVYQIYPRSFQDSNGDGIGDLPGIRSRLDHLDQLGVDVLWLSPIYASPQADNGYDISDYRSIDPTFGTMEDFDALLADVHLRGMKLVMDLVVNHTSDEHPWFVESRSSIDNEKRDWYWWRQPREGYAAGEPGAEPTNWRAFFSGPAWELDGATGEYYLHLFDKKQPDLNWENPNVRHAVYDMMRWWLDKGVDGFRMDVINLISKDTSLPDGIASGDALGDGVPFVTNGPRIHEFLQEMHREVFDGRDGDYLTVGEMPGVTWEEAILFTAPDRREVDMVFQFEHVDLDSGPGGKFDVRPFDLLALKESFGSWQVGLGDIGWNSLYWDNHDQPRAVSRFGDDGEHWRDSATALALLLHLHRGTPYVYQGEELGMTNAGFVSIDQYRDIESTHWFAEAARRGVAESTLLAALAAKSRDNARTPVQWDASSNAGFTTGEPWLPATSNSTWLNAAAQYGDPDSVFAFYRRLIQLRHDDEVVALGDFEMLVPTDPRVYAFRRTLGDRVLVAVVNVSGADAVADIDVAGASVIIENMAPRGAGSGAGPTLSLAPWEARVYETSAR